MYKIHRTRNDNFQFKTLSRSFLFIAFMLGSMICFGAPSVKLSVSSDRGKRDIEVGDRFYITVEVKDMDGTPKLGSDIPGAKTMYFDHTGQTSSMTSVNGQVTRTSSNIWTATMRANKEGNFTYGPITVNGVKSNTLHYTIGKKSQQQSDPSAPNNPARQTDPTSDKPQFIGKGDGNLFLKATASQTSVYEQQAIVYLVKLYTTYDAIKFVGAAASPQFDGFVVEESKDISTQFSYETYNGKTYATAVIARYIIFPQMTGQLKVSGNTYTVSVDQREYYHDPFWGAMSVAQPLQLNVKPNDLVINVKPLPTPKPGDFSGGVGKFNLSSQLKSNDFKSNQASSIVYTVTGVGNLKYIQMPDLSTIYPSQLEVYSPTTDVKDHVGSTEVSGSVSFDYSFMPLEEGEFTIPRVKLVYFNPETGKYETTESREYTIQVGKGIASNKSQVSSKLKFDSNLEKISTKDLKLVHKPEIETFLFWLWYIIPVIILISAIGYTIYNENQHADMLAFNSKRANKMARKRLKKAEKNMKRGDVDGFYDELLIGLWGYLGDKLKIPTSELMRDNIKSILVKRGISEAEIDNLVNLIDECEFAKYSPESGKSGMNSAYSNAIDIINRLEKGFKNSKSNKDENEN